jgi:hypothetical protein
MTNHEDRVDNRHLDLPWVPDKRHALGSSVFGEPPRWQIRHSFASGLEGVEIAAVDFFSLSGLALPP